MSQLFQGAFQESKLVILQFSGEDKAIRLCNNSVSFQDVTLTRADTQIQAPFSEMQQVKLFTQA